MMAGDTGDVIGQGMFAGVVSGWKWEDANGNAIRDANERGLAGVEIYADLNGNSVRDVEEPATITRRDNPETDFDEAGFYSLAELPVGKYMIRETVPEGYRQTFPLSIIANAEGDDPAADEFVSVEPRTLQLRLAPGQVVEQKVAITVHPICVRPFELDVRAIYRDMGPLPHVEVENLSGVQLNGCGGDRTQFQLVIRGGAFPRHFELGFFDLLSDSPLAVIPVSVNSGQEGHGHLVVIEPGSVYSDLDFGNFALKPHAGAIEGTKWLDRNANGFRDDGEPGLGGVQIYLDLNGNGMMERSEPRTTTRFDNPFTDLDEGGSYQFARLAPGSYQVREIVPDGFTQTFPVAAGRVLRSDTGSFAPGSALDLDVTGVVFQSDVNGSSKTAVEMTVVWRDSCGQLLEQQTAATVIGDHILVDLHGRQVGEVCAEVLSPQAQTIPLAGITPGHYTVVATLHEQGIPSPGSDLGETPTLGVVGEIALGEAGFHLVQVAAGETASGVDFGNHRFRGGGTLSGVKWLDRNGDGHRQSDEPGLPGVTIYLDRNGNGQLDADEPTAVTIEDPAATPLNKTGTYTFTDLDAGIYVVREVVPEGFTQTYPWGFDPGPLVFGPDGVEPGTAVFPPDPREVGQAHVVVLAPGGRISDLDFGNQPTTPGAVSGTKWLDRNANGAREDDEPGLPGVTIYVDLNFNGQFDDEEPHAVTAEDDPNTPGDETGSYTIAGLKPGHYRLAEVVPDGYLQTFPSLPLPWPWLPPLPWPAPLPWFDDATIAGDLFVVPRMHFVQVLPGETVSGLDFGNAKAEPGAVAGTKWLDSNRNRIREEGEAGLAGVVVYADLNFNGLLDPLEPSTKTLEDDPDTAANEQGAYILGGLNPGWYAIREVVPAGYTQTFPATFWWDDVIWLDGQPKWPADPAFRPTGNHFVVVRPGNTVERIDFGNAPKAGHEGSISGAAWLDRNGNGVWDDGEFGEAGATIYLDLNRNSQLDGDEPVQITRGDLPETERDEAGTYAFTGLTPGEYIVREVPPPGVLKTDGRHVVAVGDHQSVTGINFGNVPIPNQVGETDSPMGDDLHAGVVGPQATELDLSAGSDDVHSYIDAVDDQDVFLWHGSGLPVALTLSGGQLQSLSAQVLDAHGNLIGTLQSGHSLELSTERGQPYFVKVQGSAAAEYLLRVSQLPAFQGPLALFGDANRNGEVNFDDFVILANNFGKATDAAFADGDFDESGIVDFSDFVILANNFGQRI